MDHRKWRRLGRTPPEGLHALRHAIKEALNPNERRGRSQRAAAYASSHFDRAKNVAAFETAITMSISEAQDEKPHQES